MKTHSLFGSPGPSSLSLRRMAQLGFVAALLAATAVVAGPPLICRPYDIGVAKSLPPGNDAHGLNASYDRSNVVADTLALLTPDMPVLVRMETLRRAAVYVTNGMRDWDKANYPAADRALAAELLEKLRGRIVTAKDDGRVLALFDTGFFAETLRQARLDPNLDGYALLNKAAQLRPHDSEIAFALALASSAPQRKEHAETLARARAAATPGSLLAKNIQSHFGGS